MSPEAAQKSTRASGALPLRVELQRARVGTSTSSGQPSEPQGPKLGAPAPAPRAARRARGGAGAPRPEPRAAQGPRRRAAAAALLRSLPRAPPPWQLGGQVTRRGWSMIESQAQRSSASEAGRGLELRGELPRKKKVTSGTGPSLKKASRRSPITHYSFALCWRRSAFN